MSWYNRGKGKGRKGQGWQGGLQGAGGGGRGKGWGRGQGGQGGGWGRRRMGMGGPGWGPGYGAPPVPVQPTPPQQLQPPGRGAVRVAVPTVDPKGLDAVVSQVFARSPYMTFVDIVDGKPVNAVSMPNPYAMGGGGAGMAVAQWLLSSGVTVVLAPMVGVNVEGVLQSSGVRLIPVAPGTRVIDALRSAGLVVS